MEVCFAQFHCLVSHTCLGHLGSPKGGAAAAAAGGHTRQERSIAHLGQAGMGSFDASVPRDLPLPLAVRWPVFGEQGPPLRMADDCPAYAELGEHARRHLAGERARFLPVHVLGADIDG